MKNSLLNTAQIISCILTLSLFFSAANAQTSCDTWDYGFTAGPAIPGTIEARLDTFCNSSPQDIVVINSQGLVVTVHNVYSRGEAGGTAACTNYPKQIVITFSQPVADFFAGVWGARKVTASTGQTLTFNPELQPEGSEHPGMPIGGGTIYFSGGGITSVTISDPVEYTIDGTIPGAWDMWFINPRFNSEAKDSSCNCARPAIATPMWRPALGHGWSMGVEVSANDGVVLHGIMLNDRYMAEKISVPYYWLQTSAFANQRGELKPNSSDASMRSRLVEFYIDENDPDKLVIQATYVIDQIPAGSQSCLHIIQRYEFYKQIPGDNCEPSGTLPCQRWKPIVKYQFFGQGGETLTSINIAQLQHRMVDNIPYNSVGLF